MTEIINFLGLVFAPLLSPLFMVLLVAGFFFGMVYIYRLNISPDDVFHIAMAGWVFCLTIFVFRMATYLAEGTIVEGGAGWLGIAIGWGAYCLSISLGTIALKRFNKRFRKPKG